MSTQQPGKDTIYIDVDDEITVIIDKVRASHEKIVALVLPKRATVLQSIVNMKLLKRTADAAKKHLVLITAEAGLLPLAGSVGIYVAKTLQSKPEIPDGPLHDHDAQGDQEESVSMADDLDRTAPIGEHLRRTPASAVQPGAIVSGAFDDETDGAIELDNNTPVVGATSSAAKLPKGKKKFNIPNFNRFRVWGIIAGVAVVVLIFMSYMAFAVLPRATVTIKTDSTAIKEALDLRLSSIAKEVDVDNNTVPAQIQSVIKAATQQGDATGQVDKGAKATGTIQFYNCNQGDTLAGIDRTIPAGTGVSINGLTFITTQTVNVSPSNFVAATCKKNKLSSAVGIVAQGSGEKYNTAGGEFAVAPSTNAGSGIGSIGSATAGGTSEIVKVVTQADIDGLKQKIAAQDTAAIRKELQQGLVGKGLYAIEGSFTNAEPEATTNVKVGDEAPAITLTQKTTYTMMGAKQSDLKKIVENIVKGKIDTSKQQILDYGLDSAVFKLQNSQATTTLTTMNVTAIAGSDIKVEEIAKQVAGKKSNDAKEIITSYPGVTEVTVDYSPFWVSSIPKKTGKITVTVEKPVVKNAN